jgi:hexosaminidase
MRLILILITILFFIVSEINGQQVLNLMPRPSEVEVGKGIFELQEDFRISTTNGTPRLYGASTRFLRRLDGRTGIFFNQNNVGPEDVSDTVSLIIRINREGIVELNEDESYNLEIKKEQIHIEAETDIGALLGLETLLQLLSVKDGKYYFPETRLSDKPRFPWRGLLIDVARHWIPANVIKRNIDGMASVKMNVLHLHLTDDQGFRIESKAYPKLHELGSGGNYYTQEQIKDIIKYAGERGIRVIPEFDMPGHSTSWFVGYPELASAPGPYTMESGYGVQDPTMDPTKESTFQFLDRFLGEMAGLFPDRFIHIGGDENNGKQWDENTQIQAYMQSKSIVDNNELQAYFIERVLGILDKYGKRMMGWDEIFHPGVPDDILIQSWREKESLVESAKLGYNTILSNGYYIDLMKPASFHYLNDPVPENADLNSRDALNILGGEAAMWSELVTEETIDSRIWPRTAAIAERLWSQSDINDVDEMYRRLEIISVQLEEHDLQHESYYDMMLRRLAGNLENASVKTLVDVVEPLEGYQRNEKVEFTTYSPFTRLADAAHPESRTARKFMTLVENHIQSDDLDFVPDIKDWLLLWVENHKQFADLADNSPILKDAVTLSLDLSNISKIGLQALSGSVNHSDSWKEASYKQLDSASQPRMECELAVVSAIRKLVEVAN